MSGRLAALRPVPPIEVACVAREGTTRSGHLGRSEGEDEILTPQTWSFRWVTRPEPSRFRQLPEWKVPPCPHGNQPYARWRPSTGDSSPVSTSTSTWTRGPGEGSGGPVTGFIGWWLSGQSGHHPQPLPALGKPDALRADGGDMEPPSGRGEGTHHRARSQWLSEHRACGGQCSAPSILRTQPCHGHLHTLGEGCFYFHLCRSPHLWVSHLRSTTPKIIKWKIPETYSSCL